MSRTTFEPHSDGFAFTNRWTLDEAELQQLNDAFARYLTRGWILGAVAFGFPRALLVPRGILALRNKLEHDMARGYGLCGGMCFVALDFKKADLSIPRGQSANDQPRGGTRLRKYIWKRQLESLVSDGAKFLAWLIILNHIPSAWPFRGGAGWLLARSKEEWENLKASIGAGEPVPIGLVRDTQNIFDNHQVLAIDYGETDTAHGVIYLYDPNCPDEVSTIELEFGEQMLDGQESCGAPAPLRGFFCEAYALSDPREALDQPES
jgi:hypothetical protein